MAKASLARSGVPLLWDIDFDLDVRLAFQEDTVVASLPVILVEIETIASDERFRFQMTEDQATRIASGLVAQIHRLQAVEKILTPDVFSGEREGAE